jgi:uncharacterized paraquat-inducible protein A
MKKEKCPICNNAKVITLNSGDKTECPRCRIEESMKDIPDHTCKVIDLFTKTVIKEYRYKERKVG